LQKYLAENKAGFNNKMALYKLYSRLYYQKKSEEKSKGTASGTPRSTVNNLGGWLAGSFLFSELLIA
jgi:hypothetical protein